MSGGVIDTLVATSLLMALVLVVRRPVARAFGARAAYALWLAPLARLVVPPMPLDSPVPQLWIEAGLVSAVAGPSSAGSGLPWAEIAMVVWLGGVALFLAWHLVAYRRFLASVLADSRPIADPAIADAAVLESGAVTGPAATGLLVRRIIVPEGFSQHFAPDERELALLHEALHHRRGDLWASAAALLVLALHWFNPLAHAAHRAFRRDLEAACDASLLERRGSEDRPAYARTILRCVAQPMPHPSCALTHLDELKGRLEMLKLDHGALRRSTGMLFAAGLIGAGMMVAQPATAQEQEVEEIKKVTILKHGTEVITDPAEVSARLKDCVGEKFEAEAGEPADGKVRKTRILLCGRPGANNAELAAMLQKALVRLEGSDEMPAANKAEIIERLKARIAELEAGN